MSWIKSLFGGKAGDGAEGSRFVPEARACPRCQRRMLPGGTCPFCEPTRLGDDIETTMDTPHRPAKSVASLGGVVTALAAAKEHGARGFLHIYEGDNRGLTLLVADAPVPIGRVSDGNRVALHDRGVSSKHCEIRPGSEGLTLFDLGSKNGTYVNDVRVGQKRLQDGDIVALGDRTRIYIGVVQ